MKYLVRDAAELVAPQLEGGLCIEHPQVLKRINEAVMRLIQTEDYAHTLDQVNIYTTQNSITLPVEYEAARLVTICGQPVPLDSQAYEFISSGPGQNEWDQLAKLIDLGTGFLTQFDIPGADEWHILAYGADAGKSLYWRGKKADGSDFIGVQTLAIGQWEGGVEGAINGFPAGYTPLPVARLTALQLPAGRTGYTTLYAYRTSDHAMCFLGKYRPEEVLPSYRRYRLPQFNTSGMMVSLLCKKRYLPATSLDDVLLIQNTSAIKLAVMSIEAENIKDVNGAVAYKQLADQQLNQQQSNLTRGIRFNFVGYESGEGVNLI